MKVAICEDDVLFSSFLKNEIEIFFGKKMLATDITVFPDGEALINEYIKEKNYDVIFMDIGLENSDGVDIALKVRKYDKRATLIFVTSIDNRAVEGYDANAFAYIIKNKVNDKLPEVLERLWHELNEKLIFVINDKNSVNLFYADEILCVESSGRGIIIHTFNESIKANEPISRISAKLPLDVFVECHKSIYVNVEKIKRIDADVLVVINGKTFPISRRNRKNVILAVMDKVSKV